MRNKKLLNPLVHEIYKQGKKVFSDLEKPEGYDPNYVTPFEYHINFLLVCDNTELPVPKTDRPHERSIKLLPEERQLLNDRHAARKANEPWDYQKATKRMEEIRKNDTSGRFYK